jgi:GntR family transcriptional regulator
MITNSWWPPAITLDHANPLPPYEQIRRQIVAWIAARRLPAGTPLPSVRQLAGDLDVAPNTVVRAYEELERAGWISSVPRKGFQVASVPAAIGEQERLERVRAAVADLLNLALQLRLDVAMVRAEFERQAQDIEALRAMQDAENSQQP